MRRVACAFILFIACVVHGQTAQPVYDVLERTWSPYLSKNDPVQFAMKIRAVSASPRSYWGGAKDLFFIWANEHCANWLASADHRTICHGDVHAGNVGTYVTGFNKLSFGLVDFDDAAELPVEIDLLQACISIRLAAMQNKIEVDDRILAELIDANNAAAKSTQSADALLRDEPSVQKLLSASARPYGDQVDAYTSGGRFRRVIRNKRGDMKELLAPAMDRRDEIAAALAHANVPQLAEFGAITKIARRTRMGSAGSQGLDKILILTDRDRIIYLKQELPSAAERTGVTKRDQRSPGQRVSDALAQNCDPDPLVNGFCEIGDRSYSISLFEPWSAELEDVPIQSADDLARHAYIIGTVLGAAHRISTSDSQSIISRSREYMDVLMREWQSLRDDPRTKQRIAEANAFIEASAK